MGYCGGNSTYIVENLSLVCLSPLAVNTISLVCVCVKTGRSMYGPFQVLQPWEDWAGYVWAFSSVATLGRQGEVYVGLFKCCNLGKTGWSMCGPFQVLQAWEDWLEMGRSMYGSFPSAMTLGRQGGVCLGLSKCCNLGKTVGVCMGLSKCYNLGKTGRDMYGPLQVLQPWEDWLEMGQNMYVLAFAIAAALGRLGGICMGLCKCCSLGKTAERLGQSMSGPLQVLQCHLEWKVELMSVKIFNPMRFSYSEVYWVVKAAFC